MNAQIRKHEIGHIKHRSLSEFTPDPAHNVRPRNATFSGNLPADANDATRHSNNMQREEYLGEQRGFVSHPLPPPAKPLAALPTPPSSNRSDRSVTESEGEEHSIEETPPVEMMIVRDQRTGRTMRYRPVRPLGQGTFSKVVLATSQKLPATYILNETSEPSLDPKHLVAIKIVEHGPAGGADEERVELSLNREIEILQSISHPSLINLRAFDINDAEALLVLGYCPGGDLFEVASQHQETLTPPVVQRIFAEMVDAARHLHLKWIVHRDIKLESESIFPSHLDVESYR
jgi:protein-serine/threonine kinase